MIRSSLIWHYLVDNTHTRLIFLIIYERLNDIEDRINSSFCDWCCVKKITQLQGDKRKGQNKHYGQVNKTNKTNRKIIPASQKLLIRVEFKWVLQEKQRWIIICVHVIQLALQQHLGFVFVLFWSSGDNAFRYCSKTHSSYFNEPNCRPGTFIVIRFGFSLLFNPLCHPWFLLLISTNYKFYIGLNEAIDRTTEPFIHENACFP